MWTDFEIADDHLTLVLRERKRLRAIRADRKPDQRERGAQHGDEPSRKSGWIDLSRVRLSVEPRSEWAQMLHEVWRLQRDQFWVPDMSGIDWQAIYHRYEPLLARIATRSELSDLIWEIQGELGTSHAYEMGGDYRKPPQVSLGHLAAELQLAGDGASYEIVRIVDRRPLGCGRRFAAECHRRAGEGRRAHRRRERAGGIAGTSAAGAARPPGEGQGRADGAGEWRGARRAPSS